MNWRVGLIILNGQLVVFSVNDIGEDIFKYIFEKFKEISEKEDCNQGTRNYLKRNLEVFNYFKEAQNKKSFIDAIEKQNKETKKQLKSYYFRIIHQL